MSCGVQIDGGVAVITGAASGIGAGLAQVAAARGMRLVLADVDDDALTRTARAISGEVVTLQTDVRDPAALEALADAAFDHFGQVDLLFNNAGVLSSGNCWEIDLATWRRSIDVNVMGLVHGLRAFVPRMIAANRPARIVNTSSVGGLLPSPWLGAYGATKAAIVAITESLAGELAALDSPVAVSLLAPGPVKSGIMDEVAPDGSAEFMAMMRDMLTQYGLTPEEFAGRVFDAIETGEYWIVPQPETLDELLRERTEMILNRHPPTLNALTGGDVA